ncbi:hypothetical protein F0562_016913 [Nyssa sinensis]|uniref:CCHC-type domain-containing protein n=1 Tax=Nyssa sinensis TaxID=561372 RepID=A0A5J4ZGW9_9ASTE|nr:hypothetical protein F0562_016913 [Nyssa sinensis]
MSRSLEMCSSECVVVHEGRREKRLVLMDGREENRIFVGGLGWNTTERHLEEAFGRYGKILESVVMVERGTGRPCVFGFITFADRRAMEDAIREMHGREVDGRVISVNKAQPKMGGEELGYGYDEKRISGGRESYRGGDRRPVGVSDCFKCGRPGHFARECPSAGGGSDRFSTHSRFGGGGGRGDRFGVDCNNDRFDGGRYGEREHVDSRDSRYAGRDRYINDRYQPSGDRFEADRYVDWEPQTGYAKDRGYSRDGGPRNTGNRYGSGGQNRFDRGSYRDRAGPYDHPVAELGEMSSFGLHVLTSRWFTVFASILIMSVNGATYMFGLYSGDIKSSLGYDQTTLNLVSFFKDLGGNLGLVSGLINEVTPPWVVLLIGAIMNFSGYFMIWLSITGRIAKPHIWQMCLYIWIGADSQAFANTGSLITCVKNFPARRGIVLGLLKGFVGLSGAIMTQFYHALHGNNSESLILMIGWLPAAVSLVFLPIIRLMKAAPPANELKIFYHLLYISLSLAGFLMVIIIIQNRLIFSRLEYGGSASVVLILLFTPLGVVIKDEFNMWKSKQLMLNDSNNLSRVELATPGSAIRAATSTASSG